MAKLVISESQFLKLKQNISETYFNQISKNIKKGDIIKMTDESGFEVSFKVLDEFNGQIWFVCLNPKSSYSGYIYSSSINSMQGNSFKVKKIRKKFYYENKNKAKEPNSNNPNVNKTGKPDDISKTYSWDVENKPNEPVKRKPKQQTKKGPNVSEAINYNNVNPNDVSTWENFTFKNVSKVELVRNGEVIDTVDEFEGKEKKKPNDKQSSDKDTQEPNTQEPNTEEPDNQENDEQSDESGEERDYSEDASDIMDKLMNDPQLRKAYYTAPTFWNRVSSWMKGEKPEGKGFVKAYNIIRDYSEREIIQKLGGNSDKFKPGYEAKLETISNVSELAFYINQNPYTLSLGLFRVKVDKLDDINSDKITLTCEFSDYKLKFIVNKPIKNKVDCYEGVLKYYRNINGKFVEADNKHDINFKMIDGSGEGYNSKNTGVNSKPSTNNQSNTQTNT